MTALADRLRTAAAAPRLADFVRVSRGGSVYLRRDEHGAQPFLFTTGREQSFWRAYLPAVAIPGMPGISCGVSTLGEPTRDAAIRAGLIDLAEREEAKAAKEALDARRHLKPGEGYRAMAEAKALLERLDEEATP